MPQSRFAKPPYLRGRFDWVDPLGRGYTRFPSFDEAKTVAETLSVEHPQYAYSIRAI